MGILDKFLKNNKFYLELDNDKEAYKWPTKKKAKSKQVKTEQTQTDKVSSKDVDGEQQKTVQTTEQGTTSEVQSAPQAINTSYSEEPSWIKGLYLKKEVVVEEELVVVEKTFAADSAVAKPRPNRRPGGSINKFRDLARELK